MANQVPDFNQLMKIAKQVASNMEPPPGIKKGKQITEKDMSGIFGHVAQNVAKVMTPELMSSIQETEASTSSDVPPLESKISLKPEKKEKKKRVVEIESDDGSDEDPINLRTKDMHFTLSVTLEEIYNGAKKKLAIRRQVLNSDSSVVDEKKKLSIKVEPGMIDEQTIRFNHMSDEKKGHATGDVVVSIDIEEHECFVRDGNNLLTEYEVSISDCYKPVFYIKHLNGQLIKVTGDPVDFFNEDDELKKVQGLGMPLLGEPGKFGDLFIRFKFTNETKTLTDEQFELVKTLFPPKLKLPELGSEEVVEKHFEMVTESDLEFLEDSDSDDSEYDSEEESDSEED